MTSAERKQTIERILRGRRRARRRVREWVKKTYTQVKRSTNKTKQFNGSTCCVEVSFRALFFFLITSLHYFMLTKVERTSVKPFFQFSTGGNVRPSRFILSSSFLCNEMSFFFLLRQISWRHFEDLQGITITITFLSLSFIVNIYYCYWYCCYCH